MSHLWVEEKTHGVQTYYEDRGSGSPVVFSDRCPLYADAFVRAGPEIGSYLSTTATYGDPLSNRRANLRTAALKRSAAAQ